MKDRHSTLGGKAGGCLHCMMKPLGPPNYYKLQGSQSSLHESSSAGKVLSPLNNEQTEVSSLLSSVHRSWHLNLLTFSWCLLDGWASRGWHGESPLGTTSALGKQWQRSAPEESSTFPHFAELKSSCSCSWSILEWTGWEKVPSSGMDSLFLAQQSPLLLPGTFAQDLIKRL